MTHNYLTGKDLRQELESPLLGQESIVEGLIFKDTVNIFYSEPGVGKSVIALNMLASMSGGWPVFGVFPMRKFAKCSYLQLEGSRDEMLGRLKDIWSEIPIDPANIAWHSNPVFVEDPRSISMLEKDLMAYGPDIIFVDSFYCLTSKGLSKEEGFLPVRNVLNHLRVVTGAAIIILHHSQKPTYDKDGGKQKKDDPFLGSQYLKAFADMMICCESASKNKTVLRVTKKHRNNEGIERVTLAFDKTSWTVKAIREESTKSATAIVCEFIRSCKKQTTVSEIVKHTGLTSRHIRRMKNDGHFNHLVNFIDQTKGEIIWLKKNEYQKVIGI